MILTALLTTSSTFSRPGGSSPVPVTMTPSVRQAFRKPPSFARFHTLLRTVWRWRCSAINVGGGRRSDAVSVDRHHTTCGHRRGCTIAVRKGRNLRDASVRSAIHHGAEGRLHARDDAVPALPLGLVKSRVGAFGEALHRVSRRVLGDAAADRHAVRRA